MGCFTHFFLLLVLFCIIVNKVCNSHSIPKFPSILIFGDSTVDTGNNNYMLTAPKGNHPPYGIDFRGHIPTGRFSNGKLVPDFLASTLGIKETVPPFLRPDLSDDELLTGVSFASAGSGYDDLTTVATKAIPMSKQLGYFKEYVQKIRSIVGEAEAQKIVRDALVIIGAATNDFIFNFYDIPTRVLKFNISEYQDFLHTKLQIIVQELYDLGCRKMVISGLPPVGCLPIQMTVKSPIKRKCLAKENSDAQSNNVKLTKLLPQLQAKLPGSKILYADTYTPLMDMITNPKEYGFLEIQRGCCGSGLLEAGPFCTPVTPICANRSEFLFYDSIHPGESAYQYLTEKLVKILLRKFSDTEAH